MEMIMQTPSFNTECYKLPPPRLMKTASAARARRLCCQPQATRTNATAAAERHRNTFRVAKLLRWKKNTFLQDHNKLWPPATSLDIHGYPISIQVTHAAPNNSSASRCAAAASTSSNRCSSTRTAAEFPSSRTAGARSSARHWSHCRASRPGCTQTTVALLNACNYL